MAEDESKARGQEPAEPQSCAYLDVDSDKPIYGPGACLFVFLVTPEGMQRLHRGEAGTIDGEAHRLVDSSCRYRLRLDEEPAASSIPKGGPATGYSGRGQRRS